ncbi:hypothetical protein [Hymenobacter coccineus]|uniref:hypothetical protein n=1 Tax=Hymenobacter coccineus TaxID=1908235 RepID=UPI001EFBB5C3|nr:hypothetical protein [Hymenobacter coccineus]
MPTPASPASPPLRDRRFLLCGILLLAWVELVPRGLFSFKLPAGGAAVWYLGVAYGTSLLFTVVLWLGVRALWQRLLRRWPQPTDAARRLWWLAALAAGYTLGATVVLGAGVAWAQWAAAWGWPARSTKPASTWCPPSSCYCSTRAPTPSSNGRPPGAAPTSWPRPKPRPSSMPWPSSSTRTFCSTP